jgi:hypothetical protein
MYSYECIFLKYNFYLFGQLTILNVSVHASEIRNMSVCRYIYSYVYYRAHLNGVQCLPKIPDLVMFSILILRSQVCSTHIVFYDDKRKASISACLESCLENVLSDAKF